jgi:prepilin peptidase dependent protein B
MHDKEHPVKPAQRGLSIVELLVGVAIGMFIIGGAIKLFVDMFGNNRRMLIEARVNQDLRAAADVIARDVRRAGYWSGAPAAFASSAPTPNPYAATTITANSISYAYDRGAGASAAGFSLFDNTIYMTVGAASQPLTDPASVRVTDFRIANSASAAQLSELYASCPCYSIASGTAGACPNIATSASRPQASVRWVDIVIEGEAPSASSVRRRVVESVRLRNDAITGSCP